MIILLIGAFFLIILFEVPGLIIKKYWRELIAFIAILSVAFIMSFLQVTGRELPTTYKIMKYAGGLLRLK
jgi:hypothetical protein